MWAAFICFTRAFRIFLFSLKNRDPAGDRLEIIEHVQKVENVGLFGKMNCLESVGKF